MSKKQQPKDTVEIEAIRPMTPEMEAFLQAGYPDMSLALAEEILEGRKADPNRWPYQMVQKAQAFIAAYKAYPIAVDPNPDIFGAG